MSKVQTTPDPTGGGPDHGRVPSTAWSRLSDPVVIADLGAILGVAAALLVAFFLPAAEKYELALSYATPTLFSAYASHFVHFSLPHLLVNLGGFLVVAGTGYLLSLASGRRTQFAVAFVTFLTAFPLVISALNLLTASSGIAVGFSAIVMAFVGYLPVAILDFAGHRGSVPVDRTHSQGLFFLGLAVVAYAAAPGSVGTALATVALVASIAYTASTVTGVTPSQRSSFRASMAVGGHAELLVVGLVLFLAYPFVAFPAAATVVPATVPVGGGSLDVLSHALGFCLGYVATYVTLLLTG